MGLFGLFKKKQPAAAPVAPVAPVAPAAPAKKEETHRVAGVAYHEKDIMKFAKKNADYDLSKKDLINAGLIDQNIYQYLFDASNVELIPEPTNEHDPKAIKVIVDGVHIGYIKKGSCAHVRKLMDSDGIEKIRVVLGGGNYKYVYDDSGIEDEPEYLLEKSKRDFFAELRFVLK